MQQQPHCSKRNSKRSYSNLRILADFMYTCAVGLLKMSAYISDWFFSILLFFSFLLFFQCLLHV